MHLPSILILILTLGLTSCSERKHQLDCTRFRTGKFEFKIRGLNRTYLIERNERIQIESDLVTGSKGVFSVNWIDSCTYDLTLLNFLNKGSDSLTNPMYHSKFPQVRAQIIEFGKDYYVCQTVVDGKNFESRDTMMILK